MDTLLPIKNSFMSLILIKFLKYFLGLEMVKTVFDLVKGKEVFVLSLS